MRPRRTALVVSLIVIAGAVTFALARGGDGGGRDVTATPTSVLGAQTRPITYPGPTYAKAGSPETSNKEGQSRLWWAEGTWWALLSDPRGALGIFELTTAHTWRDTGVLADTRRRSTGDALLVGPTLYIVSRTAGGGIDLRRLSFAADTRTWVVDTGFPIRLARHGTEAVTIARDGTGRLWAAYTQASQPWYLYSLADDQHWSQPALVPAPDTSLSPDDVATTIAFAGHVGILWSDQPSGAFRFAVHHDGAPPETWEPTETPLAGDGMADDHMNVKASPDGTVFAVVKTSLDERSVPRSSPLVELLERAPDGHWTIHPAARVSDRLSRPVVLLDPRDGLVFVFMSAPEKGATVHYKASRIDAIAFAPGRGPNFVAWPGAVITNPSGAKQNVDATTGLIVLAADEKARAWYHGERPIRPRAP
jgi:hypothetical protein